MTRNDTLNGQFNTLLYAQHYTRHRSLALPESSGQKSSNMHFCLIHRYNVTRYMQYCSFAKVTWSKFNMSQNNMPNTASEESWQNTVQEHTSTAEALHHHSTSLQSSVSSRLTFIFILDKLKKNYETVKVIILANCR